MTVIYDEFDTVYAPPNTAINDGGSQFDSIQEAVDNADNWVLIGPGTYEEAVTVQKDNFDLIGAGVATKIDSEALNDNPITFESDHGSIRFLRVDAGAADQAAINVNNVPAAPSTRNNRIFGVTVEATQGNGISVEPANSIISNCVVQQAGNHCILVGGSGTVVNGCSLSMDANTGVRVRGSTCAVSNVAARQVENNGADGIVVEDPDVTISNVTILNAPDRGIVVQGDDVSVSNFRVTGSGGDGLVVEGTDDVITGGTVSGSAGSDIDDSLATDPHYSNVLIGGNEFGWVQQLVDSPNASIPNAVLDDGDSAEVSIPVPDGETLKVYRWGAYQISDGTTPANLDMELLDGSDTVQATENTGDTESLDPASPVASHTNSTGSVSIYKVAIANDTGATISDPGVGGFVAYIVE